MKIKDEVNLDILLDYGFFKVDKEKEYSNSTLLYSDYVYQIGHARRGQFYYYLVDANTRKISVYASEPDGSGCSIIMPNVLRDLVLTGIID
jgi:hypothetical protein